MILSWLATGDYLLRDQPWLCGLCFTALVFSIAVQIVLLG